MTNEEFQKLIEAKEAENKELRKKYSELYEDFLKAGKTIYKLINELGLLEEKKVNVMKILPKIAQLATGVDDEKFSFVAELRPVILKYKDEFTDE